MTNVSRFDQFMTRRADYSEAFTSKVARIGNDVAGRCGLTFRHIKSMNYSVAQVLVVSLNGRDDKTFRVYVSSKGPLFAIVPFEKRQDGWHASRESWASDVAVSRSIDCVRAVLAVEGLEEVAESHWGQGVPGMKTDMDGAPATVFDVLFSEIL